MGGPTIRLDFLDRRRRRAPILFADPIRVVEARSLDQIRPTLTAVDEARRAGLFAAGFVSYEAGPAFDPAIAARSGADVPLAWFGFFPSPTPATSPPVDTPAFDPPEWQPDISTEEYRRSIALVRDAIAAGDSYQANYTFRLQANVEPQTLEARYLRLVDDQKPPYAAYIDTGDWRILSLSPELFFEVRGSRIVTRPMKGTAPRGLWSDDDEARARALASSEKNRAENVMIVDLARNDLGRIAEIGSVRATSLFDVERYPSVLQMVSTVEGQLRPQTSITDIFGALFPAGSITGAPKASSTHLVASIEASPRGVYCGAIGYVTPDGDATFNVAIRTAVTNTRTGQTTYGVGGGITWDSEAADERTEAMSKAGFLMPQPHFDLLETLRLEAGQYVRLRGHLNRLFASASYFGFPADEGDVRDELAAHADAHGQQSRRVRLLLSRHGLVTVESRPLDPLPGVLPIVRLADTPVSRTDRFLHHKTTFRAAYDVRRSPHADAFDVLLWNDDRELTEFTIGNVVVEIDGVRVTPPRSSGLLGGVFRAELVDTDQVAERVIMLGDLARASRLWLVNSVREWVEVRLNRDAVES